MKKMPLTSSLSFTVSPLFATLASLAAASSFPRPLTATALLQKARPYSRKLDEQQQFDGTYSMKFSKCVDIKLLPENHDDDSVVSSVKSGTLTSTKSFVLFYMCDGDNTCYEDDLYIVDINTYAKNIASYFANYEDTICNACSKYANFCSSSSYKGDDTVSGNYDGSNIDYNNYYGEYIFVDIVVFWGAQYSFCNLRYILLNHMTIAPFSLLGNRKLKTFDCDECKEYNCFSQDNYNNDYNDDVNNLIDEISDCIRTGSNINGNDIYVGPMCSASGDGVELAVFLDDKCTAYTTQKAFGDLPSYYMYNSATVFNITKTSFQRAFSDTVSCQDLNINNPYNQANDDGNGEVEMNDYCEQVFEEGGALGLSNCNYANNGNQNQNNGNNGNYQGDDFLSWYTYDVKFENAEDIDEVCYTVNQMGGVYSNYYDNSYSGSWYSKNNKKSSFSGSHIEMGDVNGNIVAVVVILSFCLVGALAGGIYLYKKHKEKLANDKLQPLQENEVGVLT